MSLGVSEAPSERGVHAASCRDAQPAQNGAEDILPSRTARRTPTPLHDDRAGLKGAAVRWATPAAPGCASLEVNLVSGQSAVTSACATNPMKLLTPRARGSSVWACAACFGGGLVAGDQTQLELRLGAKARCHLGTQASTKIYRNPAQLPCGHETRATLEAGSLLVFAPDPVQAFAGSSYTQRQEFHLAPDASLVLLDWFTSGRAACGERWEFNRFQSRNAVYLGSSRREEAHSNRTKSDPASTRFSDEAPGQLIFLDSLLLTPDDGPLLAPHRMGRFNCLATLFLAGPAVRDLAIQLLDQISHAPVPRRASLVISASPVADGAVLRFAGEHVEAVGQELHRHLASLRDLLGDDPWARKW